LGTWVEEGSATLLDGFYLTTVGHFSSWNVDWKGPSIDVRGEVFTRIGDQELIMPYLQVHVSAFEVQQVGGFLDDNGRFEFRNFPADREFTLRILGECDEILFEDQFGPYSQNTDLGKIVVQAFGKTIHHITGTGVDCDYELIEDGYVRFRHNEGSIIYPLNEDATFDFLADVCNKSKGDVILTDLVNKKSSAPQAIDFSQEAIHYDLLRACEELETFVEIIDKDGFIMHFEQVIAVIDKKLQSGNWVENISISAESSDGSVFTMEIPLVDGLGTYTNLTSNWTRASANFPIYYQLAYSDSSIEITEFGLNGGQIIRGNFEGAVSVVYGELGKISTASGSIKIIRD